MQNSTEQEEEKNPSQEYILVPGTGKVTINKRDIDEYFGLETLKVIVRQPLAATETADKFDVLVNVRGGGYNRTGWCYPSWYRTCTSAGRR